MTIYYDKTFSDYTDADGQLIFDMAKFLEVSKKLNIVITLELLND